MDRGVRFIPGPQPNRYKTATNGRAPYYPWTAAQRDKTKNDIDNDTTSTDEEGTTSTDALIYGITIHNSTGSLDGFTIQRIHSLDGRMDGCVDCATIDSELGCRGPGAHP